METRTVRISKRVYDAVSSTQRLGQSFAGALDEWIVQVLWTDHDSVDPRTGADAKVGDRCCVDGLPGVITEVGPEVLWIRLDGFPDALPFARRHCTGTEPTR